MKFLYFIGGASVILAVGGAVAFWFFSSSVEVYVPVPEKSAELPVAPSEKETVAGHDTLQSVFALGKTLECSFRTDGEGMVTEGTAFFDNGKLRVDTMYQGTSSVADTSSLIISGDSMYTWADTKAGSFAIKMPVSTLKAGGTPQRDGEVSLQAKVRYDCKSWRVDGSVFVPPATIKFMDISEMMKNVPAGMMPR